MLFLKSRCFRSVLLPLLEWRHCSWIDHWQKKWLRLGSLGLFVGFSSAELYLQPRGKLRANNLGQPRDWHHEQPWVTGGAAPVFSMAGFWLAPSCLPSCPVGSDGHVAWLPSRWGEILCHCFFKGDPLKCTWRMWAFNRGAYDRQNYKHQNGVSRNLSRENWTWANCVALTVQCASTPRCGCSRVLSGFLPF